MCAGGTWSKLSCGGTLNCFDQRRNPWINSTRKSPIARPAHTRKENMEDLYIHSVDQPPNSTESMDALRAGFMSVLVSGASVTSAFWKNFRMSVYLPTMQNLYWSISQSASSLPNARRVRVTRRPGKPSRPGVRRFSRHPRARPCCKTPIVRAARQTAGQPVKNSRPKPGTSFPRFAKWTITYALKTHGARSGKCTPRWLSGR